MKNLYFAVSVLAALTLLAPTSGFADFDNNELGFYADQEMSATHVISPAYSTVGVFMLVTNPYNDDENRPIEFISGIEFKVTYPHEFAISINTVWENGTSIDIDPSLDSHVVGWGVPIPVVDGAAFLGIKSFLLLSDTPFGLHIGPIDY